MGPARAPLTHLLVTTPVATPSRCAVGPAPAHAPALRWLGAAGIELTLDGFTLLVDPFVTRPNLRTTLVRRLRPDETLLSRHLPRADAIVCTHSHHDHILDVPALAARTGAPVFGSPSSLNYCRAWGLPEAQLNPLSAPSTLELGPFRLTVRPSRHARVQAGRPPLPGSIGPRVRPPLHTRQFRSRQTFALHIVPPPPAPTLFHLGSADWAEATVAGLGCDLLLPALIGRHHHPGFTAGLLAALGPAMVLPIHFDDFLAPLDAPLRQFRWARLPEFLAEVRAADPTCRLELLAPGETVHPLRHPGGGVTLHEHAV